MKADDRVVVLVPVLGRAYSILPMVQSLSDATPPGAWLAHFLLSPDDDDDVYGAVREVRERWSVVSCDVMPFPVAPGDYQRKINAGYQDGPVAPLLFLAATDLRFHPGWFDEAARYLGGEIGVVGTNDLGSRRTRSGRHSTHTLVARSYVDEHGTIDEPGKVLHEGYPHTYCDDEFVRTARHRGAYAHAVRSHVEHLHPDWGKAPNDPIYDYSRGSMDPGRVLFEARAPLFGGPFEERPRRGGQTTWRRTR